MADLHILIKTSAITERLRGYATQETEGTYLKVPEADATDAITELESIGSTYSIYGDSTNSTSGSQVSGVTLPEEIVKG